MRPNLVVNRKGDIYPNRDELNSPPGLPHQEKQEIVWYCNQQCLLLIYSLPLLGIHTQKRGSFEDETPPKVAFSDKVFIHPEPVTR